MNRHYLVSMFLDWLKNKISITFLLVLYALKLSRKVELHNQYLAISLSVWYSICIKCSDCDSVIEMITY